jgi:hypothetical protein
VPANTTNLYRHVKFDEGSGTAFADEVGGADGDLLGATNGATYTTNSQCTSLSVNEETLSKNASIYPNPASSLLSIDVAGDVKLNAVQVIDLTGKVVYSADYTKTIDVSSFAKGMYLLKLNSSGASIAKKIIVD